ncbi:MAG: hypothetical protein RRA94_05315 [Bacteroidota bacterium]|nr:hypothetical protein [Bacteroidota bacterium]
MKTRTLLLLLTFVLFTACDHDGEEIIYVDDIPPLPPVGIVSVSLDNAVELSWYENQEADIAGYNVYVSDRYNGSYDLIGSTRTATYLDRGATNGITAYYAVTAYDVRGNESDLSRDVAYDTPRPEGRGVVITDRYFNAARAGYDFSEYSVLHYDTDFTDVFFETASSGAPFLVVWDDTDIQDMGYTASIDEISSAPAEGWNPTGDALVVRGHTYVIRTFDNHYAKIRIVEVGSNSIVFDWAYQVATGNPELIVGGGTTLNKRARSGLRNRGDARRH